MNLELAAVTRCKSVPGRSAPASLRERVTPTNSRIMLAESVEIRIDQAGFE